MSVNKVVSSIINDMLVVRSVVYTARMSSLVRWNI